MPGIEVTWKIAHRGRLDQDSATVALGAPDQPGVIVETMVTGPSAWQVYSGTYTVPAGQTTTRFTFAALDVGSLGNFIDELELIVVNPTVMGTALRTILIWIQMVTVFRIA